MKTSHVLAQLPLWVEGDLDHPELAAIEAHLADCAACRLAAEHLKTSQDWLREATTPPFDASDRSRLRRSVMDQIYAEAAAQPSRRFPLRSALLAACAASLFVGMLVWRQERGAELQVSPPVASSLPNVVGQPTQTDPHSILADPRPSPSGRAHHLPIRGQESESPPPGEPARIEFQTADPTIRIIWLAQAKPLPETDPILQEEP